MRAEVEGEIGHHVLAVSACGESGAPRPLRILRAVPVTAARQAFPSELTTLVDAVGSGLIQSIEGRGSNPRSDPLEASTYRRVSADWTR